MSEKRRIVLNTLANGIAQFTAMASAFVFMPFLIRAFGLTDYGLYLLAGSVASYAALLDFGVGTALAKLVAEKSASENHEDIAVLASTALAFYAVIGVVIASIMVFMGVYGGQFFHVDAAGAALLRNLFFVGAIFQLWLWPAATATYVLVGFQKYTFMAKVGLGVTLGNVAAIVLVLLTSSRPGGPDGPERPRGSDGNAVLSCPRAARVAWGFGLTLAGEKTRAAFDLHVQLGDFCYPDRRRDRLSTDRPAGAWSLRGGRVHRPL